MPTTDPLNPAEHPTVFQKLLEPVERFVQEQSQQLPKHPREKYTYEAFFRLLIDYFVSGTKSLKLLINAQLNLGLLPAALGLQPVPYSTCQEAFERFSPRLFQAVFQHLLSTVSFKAIPELATLGTVCCIDGSLFPVISSMLWAAYTTHHQALKLHLCFELNRMIPVDFWVGSGNSSERQALRHLLVAGVTYIADRGYMSFQLCYDICQAQAHFLFRTKTNLCFTVVESWPVVLPAAAQKLFQVVTDELICYDNDPHSALYRLVRVVICQETYFLLTNRQDLTTWLILGFEDVIKFELRPLCACPPCAASTTSSMKENVTKKSDGYAGLTGCVVRVARPTKSPSEVATTGNKPAADTLARTVESDLTTSPEPSSWGGISPCRFGSLTCT